MLENQHIFELAGGLGNQLFQISAARELVKSPTFDVSMLRMPFLMHPVDLSGLVKREQTVDLAMLEGLRIWRLKNAFFTRVSKFSPIGKVGSRLYLDDKGLNFSEIQEFLSSSHKQLRVRGYFQDPQFVSKRQVDFFRTQIPNPTRSLLSSLDLEPKELFTAVHYRLGDLISLGKALPPIYFLRAFSALLEKNALHRKILLFSDHPDLAATKLAPVASQLGLKLRPVENLNPREMLAMFGSADTAVISNSTLAWWAIKLSTSTNMVVSPWDWRNGDSSHKLVDDSWLIIDE